MKLMITTDALFPKHRNGEETDAYQGAEAVRLIQAGYAVPVIEEEIEVAVKASSVESRKKG